MCVCVCVRAHVPSHAIASMFISIPSYHILPCIMCTHIFVRVIRRMLILIIIPMVCNRYIHV